MTLCARDLTLAAPYKSARARRSNTFPGFIVSHRLVSHICFNGARSYFTAAANNPVTLPSSSPTFPVQMYVTRSWTVSPSRSSISSSMSAIISGYTFNLSLHPAWATISLPLSTMTLCARDLTLAAPYKSASARRSSTFPVFISSHRLESHICFNSHRSYFSAADNNPDALSSSSPTLPE